MTDEDVNQFLRRGRFEAAFELLLERYQNKVFRLAISILREPARAEDATQDAFTKLWQALPFYDGRAAVSTWLYTIARNTCLSEIRAQSYRAVVSLEDAPERCSRETISTAVEMHELIDRLPENQRQVITLFYLEERNVQAVSRMLDLPEGTVKSHLHRARRALAAWLEK